MRQGEGPAFKCKSVKNKLEEALKKVDHYILFMHTHFYMAFIVIMVLDVLTDFEMEYEYKLQENLRVVLSTYRDIKYKRTCTIEIAMRGHRPYITIMKGNILGPITMANQQFISNENVVSFANDICAWLYDAANNAEAYNRFMRPYLPSSHSPKQMAHIAYLAPALPLCTGKGGHEMQNTNKPKWYDVINKIFKDLYPSELFIVYDIKTKTLKVTRTDGTRAFHFKEKEDNATETLLLYTLFVNSHAVDSNETTLSSIRSFPTFWIEVLRASKPSNMNKQTHMQAVYDTMRALHHRLVALEQSPS
jgi:hypothetical protein